MRHFSPCIVAIGLLLGSAPILPAFGGSPEIDTAALIKAGQDHEKKLATSPASWTAVHNLANGMTFTVSTLHAGDKERVSFSVNPNGKPVEILRIIVRDGLWYVVDPTRNRKYRPNEFPAESPVIYMCLERNKPIFIDAHSPVLNDRLESVNASTATYRHPLDARQAEKLLSVVAQTEAAAPQFPGGVLPPEDKARIDELKDLVTHGTPVRVDISTGQVVQYGSDKFRTRMAPVRILAKSDESAFVVSDRQWEDFSDDPTTGDVNDLIMIAHGPNVQVGQKDYDVDARVMNVKTGRFRRIPFAGINVLPGCFLSDRMSVVACGMDSDSGSLRPYEISLRTGKNTPLGGEALRSGYTLGGSLSPDGKTVAVTHMDPSAGLLTSRVCLIDMATKGARFISQPMDTNSPVWTADGRHLVLTYRQSKDLKSVPVESIAIMDMQGVVTSLLGGSSPIVLADGKTILFEDSATRLWQTCDLQGQNVKLYADGLKGYGFPTVSPAGQELLMMHFSPGSLPIPTRLPLGQAGGKPVTNVGGLWAMPTWR